ncbi:MAG: cation:proton antiporter [Calditrichaeota bacterium]|nr:cation:proton antiporter [Calditrichota bacterium]
MHFDILILGLLIFVAHLFEAIFKKLKIPDVLLLMLIGIVIGPGFHLVSPQYFGQFGSVITGIALIVILFDGGSHLSLHDLKESLRTTLGLALATFLVSTVTVAAVSHYMIGLDWLSASLIGVICGAISPVVVLPIITALNLSKSAQTVMTLETAFTDVLAIILAFSLIDAISQGTLSPLKIGSKLLLSFFIAGLIGFAAALIWSFLLNKVRQFPNTTFTTFAFLFIIYGIAELFHFSGAITCLAFGMTLSNLERIKVLRTKYLEDFDFHAFDDDEHSFFSEIKFLLKTFFFIFLGMSFQFDQVEPIMIGLLITIVLILFRMIIVRLSASKTMGYRELLYMSVMIPKGLASAVLASIPLQLALPHATEIQMTTYSVILWTILFTSILVFLIEKTSLENVIVKILGLSEQKEQSDLLNESIYSEMNESADHKDKNRLEKNNEKNENQSD